MNSFLDGRLLNAGARGQPWKDVRELAQNDFFHRVHQLFNEINAPSTLRQSFTEYHAGKQAKKTKEDLTTLVDATCLRLSEIVQNASFVQFYLSRSLSLATAITLSRAPADPKTKKTRETCPQACQMDIREGNRNS